MWSDMVVKYKDKIIVNTKQCLFNSADGINAIFGPTGIHIDGEERRRGCGKTSLLKALSGRLNRAKGFEINGVIFLNGKLLKREEVGRYIGYVNNRDKLCKYLTVRETLEQALYITEPTTVYIIKERKGKEIGTMNRSSRVWIIC